MSVENVFLLLPITSLHSFLPTERRLQGGNSLAAKTSISKRAKVWPNRLWEYNYIYHMCIYIYISIDTKMKMIMSKSSFCCFISSCGGLQFFILFQKSYPIFCLDTRYTPSRALLAAVMMFIPRSRLVWLIMCGVQKRTGFNQYIKTYQYPTSTSSIMFSPFSIMFGSWSVIRSSLDH